MSSTDKGWPRPRGEWVGQRGIRWPAGVNDGQPKELPIPWIILLDAEGNPVWTSFHDDSVNAHRERLCQICGESLNEVMILGSAQTSVLMNQTYDVAGTLRETSGPGMHPRCAALAVKYCPHFGVHEDDYVAYRYRGKYKGYIYKPETFVTADPEEADENVYSDINPVLAKATPITRARVKKIARLDPMGLGEVRA